MRNYKNFVIYFRECSIKAARFLSFKTQNGVITIPNALDFGHSRSLFGARSNLIKVTFLRTGVSSEIVENL